MNTIIEYIWLDGYKTPNLRSKLRVIKTIADTLFLEEVPDWSFDGSSTGQAEGKKSDCILKPIKLVENLFPGNISDSDHLVLCEVETSEGKPHKSNTRHILKETHKKHLSHDVWTAIEQEYFIFNPKTKMPLGWPKQGYPNPQGRYYCGIGGDVALGREISDRHLNICLNLDLKLSGTNAEVAPAQWEYQLGPLDPLECADQLWLSRFALNKLAESEGLNIRLDPKLILGDWNGSGAHINFSTKEMRESLTSEEIGRYCNKLKEAHSYMMGAYGHDNEKRLTGHHETCAISEFKYGVGDRSASIRIPSCVMQDGKGYLEDRRPGANLDPYKALAALVSVICE